MFFFEDLPQKMGTILESFAELGKGEQGRSFFETIIV